jgi:hypothetical protein
VNDDMIVLDAYIAIDPAITSDPTTTTSFVPHRNTSLGALGDIAIMPIATGMARSPASSGE